MHHLDLVGALFIGAIRSGKYDPKKVAKIPSGSRDKIILAPMIE